MAGIGTLAMFLYIGFGVTYVTCDNAFTTTCWFGNNLVTSVTCDHRFCFTNQGPFL